MMGSVVSARPMPFLASPGSSADVQTHPQPAFRPPLPRLRRLARQHGCLGIQGIHPRHAVPQLKIDIELADGRHIGINV